MDLRDHAREDIAQAATFGVVQLIAKLRDGKLDHDELEEAIVELVSTAIDAAIPTGPADGLDDAVIRAGVVEIYQLAAILLERDPARMRKRAARLRDSGHDDKADELEKRAATVAERHLVRATVSSGG